MELKIESGCNVGEFHKRHNLSREDHKYVFVEHTHFDQDEHIVDVILMEKVIWNSNHALSTLIYFFVLQVSRKLFTYPCARLIVRKCLTDEEGKIREEIQDQWRVFAVCKPKKESVFEEDTSVLCQVF